MKHTLMALAASCAVLAAGPVVAGDSMVVVYSDLNLTTAAGQKQLEKRIDNAAREFCGYNRITTGTRLKPAGAKRCVEQAKAQAKEQFATVLADKQLGG